jgi:hypothetical protein
MVLLMWMSYGGGSHLSALPLLSHLYPSLSLQMADGGLSLSRCIDRRAEQGPVTGRVAYAGVGTGVRRPQAEQELTSVGRQTPVLG